MAIKDQVITDNYAIYNADCVEMMKNIPDGKIHLSVYSPPFGGLYNYSSDDRDLSNCDSYDEFFDHYEYVVKEITRVTMPGRMSAIHCMDVPKSNSGTDSYIDFPGDIIKLHEKHGWSYAGRHMIWKEPLAVRLRTMQKNLAHAALCEDSIDCGVAAADYLLLFRKKGKNPEPVKHPVGMLEYAGSNKMPSELLPYKGWTGKQTENRYSHWIWRNYASSNWDDIRLGRVLPYKESRDEDDEKHVHPLQMDVIERIVQLRTNPGDTVLTPFMGVGSEVYVPLTLGRKAIGAELKPSYFKQAVKNCAEAMTGSLDQYNEELNFEDGEM